MFVHEQKGFSSSRQPKNYRLVKSQQGKSISDISSEASRSSKDLKKSTETKTSPVKKKLTSNPKISKDARSVLDSKTKANGRNNATETQRPDNNGNKNEKTTQALQNNKNNLDRKGPSGNLRNAEETPKPKVHKTIKTKPKVEGYENLGCLHEWFSRECPKHYEKTAVYFEGRTQTFRDLDYNSTLIAAWLQKEAKIQVGDMVAIFLPKSLVYPTVELGILKSGAAFLPLDTNNPDTLLASVMTDAKPKGVITNEQLLKERLEGIRGNLGKSGPKCKILVVDDEDVWRLKMLKGKTNSSSHYNYEPPDMTLDDLASTMYTSGTTGDPKGVLCSHKSHVFAFNRRHLDYPYMDFEDAVNEGEEREGCNLFFVWEILRPLLKGEKLYVIPDNTIYDPRQFVLYLIEHKITRITVTPSLLETVMNSHSLPPLDKLSLRVVILCGEIVTTKLLRKARRRIPNVTIVNLYSLSESHDISMENLSEWTGLEEEAADIDQGKKICPAGTVFPEVSIAILNDQLELQPNGVHGHIYVGGPGLTLGYVGKERLTDERLIDRPIHLPDSFGTKLLQTGDWGYLLPNNKLEVCGRVDSMVKIRGFSIELKAVESSIMKLPSVENCVAIAEGDEGDDKLLVAYVIITSSERNGETWQKTQRKEIRDQLKRMLPFYMIPANFVFLDQLPLMDSTGKLDRKTLAASEKNQAENVTKTRRLSTVVNTYRKSPSSLNGGAIMSPTSEHEELSERSTFSLSSIEDTVHRIWCQVLMLKQVDFNESFFDMGGHSLAATYLLELVQNKFDVDVRVHELFQYATISQFSKLIDSRKTGSTQDTHIKEEEVDLQAEVEKFDEMNNVKTMDIELRTFWKSMDMLKSKNDRACVLLTGATGFLGAFILQELLLSTNYSVICLVREGGNGVSVQTKLRRSLETSLILPSTQKNTKQKNAIKKSDSEHTITDTQKKVAQLFESRVTVVKADISLNRLGVDEETYNMLQLETDIIIHSAAQVNLVYPYEALKSANVQGTRNLIKLASDSSKIKPFHFISSRAMYPPKPGSIHEEDTPLDDIATGHTEGYGQSKWVSEKLLEMAQKRGLPAVVYRPGFIGGDCDECYWNPQDTNLAIFQAITATGFVPRLNWALEMTRVDFVSKFVVKCVQDIKFSNGKRFNMVQPKPLDSETLYNFMENYGYKLQRVSIQEWIDKVQSSEKLKPSVKSLLKEMNKNDSLFPLERTKFSVQQTSKSVKYFRMQNYPSIDNEYLQKFFTKQIERNNLMSPQSFHVENEKLLPRRAVKVRNIEMQC